MLASSGKFVLYFSSSSKLTQHTGQDLVQLLLLTQLLERLQEVLVQLREVLVQLLSLE